MHKLQLEEETNMRSLFKLITLFGIMINSLFAIDVGESLVSRYDVTFKKLEIFNSTTSSWVIISDTTTTVDIASASAGDDIAAMALKGGKGGKNSLGSLLGGLFGK